MDHTCGQPNGARAPSPVTNPLMGTIPKAGAFPPLGAHGVSEIKQIIFPCKYHFHFLNKITDWVFTFQPFQPVQAPLPTSIAGWMANPSAVPHPAASAGPMGLGAPSNAGTFVGIRIFLVK